MRARGSIRLAGAAALLLRAAPAPCDGPAGGEADSPWAGRPGVPLHRLRLYDENGEAIVPTAPGSMPFSSRRTCGGCHDYDTIRRGHHFNYADAAAFAGRRGEPWIRVDDAAGVQVPVAARGRQGAHAAADAAMTDWSFVLEFGRHLPGGGPGESPDPAADGRAGRWSVSGGLEINCLACHGGPALYDGSEWARQVGRENFRWAATAASGLGEVGGMASRMPDTWDVYQGPNQDDTEYAVAPFVRYDLRAFDRRHRTVLDIPDRPLDRNCLHCHAAARAGAERMDADRDVHARAGLACVDCHRNGLDHRVARGYETEAADRGDARLAGLSCRGCHMAAPGSAAAPARDGRLGAREPRHKGLPPVHFDKLSCTACHSGVRTDAGPVRVRTARANRLGIYGRARWDRDLPFIVEPVFMKGEDGKIAPHRVAWPAFWARVTGAGIRPIVPGAMPPGSDAVLRAPVQAGRILAALEDAAADGVTPVLVASGTVYRCDADGGLERVADCTNAPAEGILWGRLSAGAVSPLQGAFDPSAEDLDRAVSGAATAVLKALTRPVFADRGRPVMAAGQALFHLDEDGLLTGTAGAEVLAGLLDRPLPGRPAGADPWWGWLKDRRVEPLADDRLLRWIRETDGTGFLFTEDQVAEVLKLDTGGASATNGALVYVCAGKVFALDPEGRLAASDHPAARPVAWPIGHEVRPARQALGARTCGDCHSAASPFFFAQVAAVGPLKTDRAQVRPMHEWMAVDAPLQRTMGRLFAVRPALRIALLLAVGCMAVVLLLFGLKGLDRLTKSCGPTDG